MAEERLMTQSERKAAALTKRLDSRMAQLSGLLTQMEAHMELDTIYRVTYLAQIDGAEDDWQKESVDVLSNGDARTAVSKAERHVLSLEWEWTDDDDKDHTSRHTGFALVSVEMLARADI